MAIYVTCPTCDGSRQVPHESGKYKLTCPECQGLGNVVDTTGTQNLVALLDGVLGSAAAARVVLDTLDANRDDLAAWLREVGFLNATSYQMAFKRGATDGWGHSSEGAWKPAPVGENPDPAKRLFRIRTAA